MGWSVQSSCSMDWITCSASPTAWTRDHVCDQPHLTFSRRIEHRLKRFERILSLTTTVIPFTKVHAEKDLTCNGNDTINKRRRKHSPIRKWFARKQCWARQCLTWCFPCVAWTKRSNMRWRFDKPWICSFKCIRSGVYWLYSVCLHWSRKMTLQF